MRFRLCLAFSILTLTTACQKGGQPQETPQELSKNHLREALNALTAGDEARAETELNASLAADPLNSQARTTLASLYSQRAGIKLQDWLQVFLDTGKKLEIRARELEHAKKFIDELYSRIGTGEKVDQSSRDQEDFLTGIEPVSNFAFGISLVVDVFRSAPSLSDDQLHQLDLAIRTLREEAVAASERSEGGRIYLAILSTIRLVDRARLLVGEADPLNFKLQRDRLCAQDAGNLKLRLSQIQDSLTVLEEGLTVSSKDPDTAQRRGRERLRKSVAILMDSGTWTVIDELLDSSTPRGASAQKLVAKVCALDPTSAPPPVTTEPTSAPTEVAHQE
ncbi:MAG: hypothetical protein JST16_15155 [Bdellovibrionales bacterium]|nr:hypothetical protein [Bdellovibrionales bacterium]